MVHGPLRANGFFLFNNAPADKPVTIPCHADGVPECDCPS